MIFFVRKQWMAFLSISLVIAGTTPVAAEEVGQWLQWRGPQRDSQIVGGPDWPRTLQGEAFQQLWRVELGQGYPGPIVTQDKVFVAETRDKKQEVVRALDRKTGKVLWETDWEGAMTVPFFAGSNGSWIRSTPAYDGECLYVAGMRDVLVCIEGATGKVRWRADLMDRYKTPLPAFGFVCSPLVDGDAVYVQAAASFLKLNKKTGETIWRSLSDEGGMNGSAFSSPKIATLNGKRQLLVQTRVKLAGIDIDTGKPLWSQSIPTFRGMNILTPLVYDNGVFTSAYGGKAFFYRMENKDSADMTIQEAWNNPAEAYMSSPVVVGNHAYVHLRNQRVCCIDLKTGKTTWTSTKSFGKYWSMVAHNDLILALDERGELILFKANPEKYEELDRRSISKAETWGHLAIAGDEIFVRELNAIAAYRWRGGNTKKD